MKLIILALLVVPTSVQAQQVFKCVKGKEISYQSEPCDGDQATAKTWEAQQYAPPSNAELWRVHNTMQATAQRDAELRGQGHSRSTGTSIPLRAGACEEAKQARDRQLAALGEVGRRIEVRRAHDAQVRAACDN